MWTDRTREVSSSSKFYTIIETFLYYWCIFVLGQSREADRGLASKWDGFKVSEIYIRVIDDNIYCSLW